MRFASAIHMFNISARTCLRWQYAHAQHTAPSVGIPGGFIVLSLIDEGIKPTCRL